MQWQLNKSNEEKQKQLVYITKLETTLVDTDRILKKLSDDILKKEQKFKSCKGRQPALTTDFFAAELDHVISFGKIRGPTAASEHSMMSNAAFQWSVKNFF